MKIEIGKSYHVPTQELEDDFLKQAEEQGFLFRSGRKPTNGIGHSTLQENLCICTFVGKRLVYSSLRTERFENNNGTIRWEVGQPKPEIIRLGNLKIVFNGDYTIVTDGRFTGKAKRNPADKYDAVVGLKLAVERCEKARNDYFSSLSVEEIIKEVSGGKVAWKR